MTWGSPGGPEPEPRACLVHCFVIYTSPFILVNTFLVKFHEKFFRAPPGSAAEVGTPVGAPVSRRRGRFPRLFRGRRHFHCEFTVFRAGSAARERAYVRFAQAMS
jgi:hypothetical protein